MKSSIRYSIVLLLLILPIVPILAAGEKEDEGKLVIGAAIQGNKSTFMQFVVAGMQQYTEENRDQILLKIVFADDRADNQITQVERFIAAGVDAILLNPVDRVASAVAVDAANEAGIPILTVNTTVENQHRVQAHIGSDDVEAGELQMQRLIDTIGGRGNVAIIQAVMGHPAQTGRDQGYDNVLAKYPNVKVIYRQPADWEADKAQRLVENWLQRAGKIDAIATQVDMMAMGALYALEEKGIDPLPHVSGMDCIDEAMRAVKAGLLDSSIWQDGVAQGYHSVRLAMELILGGEVEDYFIPFEVVTKENIDQYMKKAAERDRLAKKYF